MFSKMVKIFAMSMVFSGAAFADGDDWGFRYHHHQQFGSTYSPYYSGGAFAPQTGYYPAPQPYFTPPPPVANYYGYGQQMPIHHRRWHRDDRW